MSTKAIVVAICVIAGIPSSGRSDSMESGREPLKSIVDHRTCIDALYRLYQDRDLLARDMNIVGGSLNAMGGKVDGASLDPAKAGLQASTKAFDEYIVGLAATCDALRPRP